MILLDWGSQQFEIWKDLQPNTPYACIFTKVLFFVGLSNYKIILKLYKLYKTNVDILPSMYNLISFW